MTTLEDECVRPAPAPVDWTPTLGGLLPELRPRGEREAELVAAMGVLASAVPWRSLPNHAQTTLVELLAARLRAVQESPGFADDPRIASALVQLSAHMKRARPGFAHGLARGHAPARGSWDADAEALYDRLAALLPAPAAPEPKQHGLLDAVEGLVRELAACPADARSAVVASLRRQVRAALAAGVQARNPRLVRILGGLADDLDGSEFRALRRALREEAEEARAEAEEEEEGAVPHLPADWAWWACTRGKRALVVGGDPREPSRLRLERAFAFGELEWIGAEYKRLGLQSVRDRVRAGRTDLVILLTRFIGHDADQIILPACRDTGVPFVSVQHGYGVLRVRRAIERFLDPEPRR